MKVKTLDDLIEKIEEKLKETSLSFDEKLAYGVCLSWVSELIVSTNKFYLLNNEHHRD